MATEIVYWDSDCILGWLKAEVDKADICRGTLDKASNGELVIGISAISLIEVIKLKDRPHLRKEQETTISEFFENYFFKLFDVTRFLSEYARNLIWQYNLKPKDSIHVATAVFNNIPKIHTFDSDLLKLDGEFNLDNNSSKLIICKPDIPFQAQLPLN